MRFQNAATLLVAFLVSAGMALAADAPPADVIPHRQTKPPGPPLSPEQAIARMTVSPGFSVELVAAEPDIINPVAMTFDERGRIWITESVEYPRTQAGAGRDRVKVLEDTTGDGRADRVTVFAEGLNIPSGIAVGHGGVWVANAPDILLLRDTTGDGRCDSREVVVTGFGRTDTHELPNSLTWGPDGWLYGLNGVFNHSHVKQGNRQWRFNCAMFRIHPRTREFQLFAEGTSNPWGIAFDPLGSAFVSACVIDHLWHITETGYYHRQAGPYPPFTWKIESIVNHKHQLAAYCGIHYFDSNAYPAAYRDKLVMGNVHGGCINVDAIRPQGASYFGTPEPDLLIANDPWFMPVAQKTGPDGCLYILDWYDRYHCYQDARRDPEGIDRGHGRLYRLRYRDTPRAAPFDLSTETDEVLVDYLGHSNVFFRDLAQRVLTERPLSDATRGRLQRLVLDPAAGRKQRMHALFVLVSHGQADPRWLVHDDPVLRAWAIRALGDSGQPFDALADALARAIGDPAPAVRLQAAIAAAKRTADTPPGDPARAAAVELLVAALTDIPADSLLARIVWQNLHPRLPAHPDRLAVALAGVEPASSPMLFDLLPRIVDRLLAEPSLKPDVVVQLVAELANRPGPRAVPAACLQVLATRLRSGEVRDAQRTDLVVALEALVSRLRADAQLGLQPEAACVAGAWGDAAALEQCHRLLTAQSVNDDQRLALLDVLAAHQHAGLLEQVIPWLIDARRGEALRSGALTALARLDSADVADRVLAVYAQLSPSLQPQAIELLTTRVAWSRALVAQVESGQIPPAALNVNQLRKLLASKDASLVEQVARLWGTVRSQRNAERERIVREMGERLVQMSGDAHRGQAVFHRLCGQCHKIHGQGFDVGPDITVNGRGSFEQLLSNVFDPSLVIGAAYRAQTVITTDGRVITGLLVEDTPQRVVLKLQGGKQETIARAEIDEMAASQLSLMPEGIEKQLTIEELADLFAFLALDKPPTDPSAQLLPNFPNLTSD